jgi:membrane-bound lytic murein transglycosylase D
LTLTTTLPSIPGMLGGETIRAGAAAGLLAACLWGCATPFSSTRGVPLPASTESASPGAAAAATPAQARDGRHDAREGERDRAADLWRRIIIEFKMTPPSRRHIEAAVANLQRSGDFISAATQRAGPYLHFIYQEIERRRLPFEIALVPIVESGYAPRATSPEGAAGLWQLMAATGHRFGVHQSRWYDGRRDIIASTHAALEYFEQLRDRFNGDWLLVFAAYNCGERTVERAIEHNQRAGRPTDFWSLELPRETELYVPKLLALIEVLSHPEAHGVTIADISYAPYFGSVDVEGALDMNRVIAWSGVSAEEFEALNPGFRTRYSVNGAPTRVLLPKEKTEIVAAAIASLSGDDRMAPRAYTIASGETLSHIATRAGVTIAALKRANGMRSSRIHAGQSILIPVPGSITDASDAFDSDIANAAVHVIAMGDTLWDLARLYGTTTDQLAAANGMRPDQTLRPGRELRLPGGNIEALPDAPLLHYEVKKGDSLWTISRRFKVSVAELKRWNGLSGKGYLKPGQRLLVYQPASAQVSADREI